MPLTRRALLATTGTSLALAGCVGGGTEGDGSGDPTVQVREHATYGDILVDAEGMTLYRFDADTQGAGESACTGGCAEAWPPLTTSGEPAAGDGVTAPLSTFERADGSRQVAADGWPLYTYASDGAPGGVSGQSVNDVWWVVGPDGAKITTTPGASGRDY